MVIVQSKLLVYQRVLVDLWVSRIPPFVPIRMLSYGTILDHFRTFTDTFPMLSDFWRV